MGQSWSFIVCIQTDREGGCMRQWDYEWVTGYVQALPEAIDEGLEQRFVVGDGLQYVAIIGHIADGPLAKPCTAESEDVTVWDRKRSGLYT